jgi:hypothetical protein
MDKECLECGMINSIPVFDITDWNKHDRCLKCDAVLILQHNGSTHNCDIAHGRETVDKAMSGRARRAWSGFFLKNSGIKKAGTLCGLRPL